ncbi:hypothetical protein DEO72_LG1g2781 [Vigna unguiculata]|uniref:Uncharacterized protein n=1 Tax=Vigna unguiculata TaxID=3917 RepID=A0A4D6KNL1_VIGUN|nr:hypothetical protein DEO72_LG1g2781 [Vigna unguiculata]
MPRLLIEPRPYSLIRVQNPRTPFSSPRCISPLSLFLSTTCCSSHPPPPCEALQPRCAAIALLRPPSPQAVGGNFSPAMSPQLLRLRGRASSAMNGGTSSTSSSAPASFAATATRSTILVLRLDLDKLEWDEATRMPLEMFRAFRESTKFKVFGGGDRVCFSAKRIGKLALWDRCAAEGEHAVAVRWVEEETKMGREGKCFAEVEVEVEGEGDEK